MKIENIKPCICIKYKPESCVSTYYGNPVLKVCAGTYKGKVKNYFEAVCPRCGYHSMKQFPSVYLALKDWNERMDCLWNMKDAITGKKEKDFDSLPSLMDGDGWDWNEPQHSINLELEEWRL